MKFNSDFLLNFFIEKYTINKKYDILPTASKRLGKRKEELLEIQVYIIDIYEIKNFEKGNNIVNYRKEKSRRVKGGNK